jgi:ArsR family transcriptional regulator
MILFYRMFGIVEVIDPRIFQLHADMCKMLANPKRLMMLTLLSRREMSVGELAEHVQAPMTTVSQHLSALREQRLVTARKDKQTVYYKLADPRILEACTLIRSVLIDGMKERGELAKDISPEGYYGLASPREAEED